MHATRSGQLLITLVLSLFWFPEAGFAVCPTDETLHLQFFGSVDQSIVSVGEPFFFRVELFASPSSESVDQRLRRSFEEGNLHFDENELEFVRTDGVVSTLTLEGDLRVLKLSEQYIMRAKRVGPIAQLNFEFKHEDRIYTISAQPVTVYRVDPIFFKMSRSIFPVVAKPPPQSRLPARTGTAFLIGPDAIVTSFHVVMDAHRVEMILPDGRTVVTRRAWVLDPIRDVAILHIDPGKIEEADLPYLELAPVDEVVQLESEFEHREMAVFTNGWSSGRQRSTVGKYYRSVRLQPHEPLWVSSNALRPGDSGGPLLDSKGRVLAVVTSGTLQRDRDQLREDVCIASDPRPAMGMKLLTSRPRSLKSLLKDPDILAEPRTDVLRVSAMLATGRIARRVLDEALAQIDSGIVRIPHDARLHFIRGTLVEHRGVISEAIASYQAAINTFDGYFPATYMLAINHLNRREYDEARRLFERTKKYPPYAHLANYGIALTLMRRLQYDKALLLLKEVIRYDPTHVPALYDLARCFLALGDEIRARQLVVKIEESGSPWAERLRRVIRYPILRPMVLVELDRSPIRALPVP